MKWTDIPHGDINGASQRLWAALGESADKVAVRINTDPAFVAGVAQFMFDGCALQSKVTTSLNPAWLRARSIMGQNFFGIEEAIKHFKVNPSKSQLATLAEIPWSEEVLESVKETHILVAVFPLSILDIRGRCRDQRLFYGQDWYNNEAFAKAKGECVWQLIHKTPVADSTKKTWGEQQALLDSNEETPTARVMVYTIIGHFLAEGARLFEKIYVRCSDLDSDGDRVYVGCFGSGGLYVYGYWDDNQYSDIGLSGARKQ